jgi:HKD family nuclease
MSEFAEDLEKSLKTGFLDRSFDSQRQMQPDFILNDRIKGSKVLSYLLERLDVCDSFWLSAAFLTTSGLSTLHNSLKKFSDKANGEGKIYVSDYLAFTQPEALRRIRQFKNIDSRLLVGKEFHGKGYLFKIGDQFDCLIGSSNLTATALTRNDELNFHFTASSESKAITDFLGNFDNNFNSSTTLSDELLEGYSKKI